MDIADTELDFFIQGVVGVCWHSLARDTSNTITDRYISVICTAVCTDIVFFLYYLSAKAVFLGRGVQSADYVKGCPRYRKAIEPFEFVNQIKGFDF